MQDVISIEWVKDLSDSDLILINLLTFCAIYHYNPLYDDIGKCVTITEAEAYGIMRVTVKLRTRDNKVYTPSPYYVPEKEAYIFRDKFIKCFEEYYGQKGKNVVYEKG